MLKFLPGVPMLKATFNSVYKCEKASKLKGLASKKIMPLANFSKLSKKLNLNLHKTKKLNFLFSSK